jgi:tRNA (Thr-GGU) A37 N-methylase
VTIEEMEEAGRIKVHPLEAVDGTPILDIKPFLAESEEEHPRTSRTPPLTP